MNQTTRQRITGSLVLALAALILLPVIFDGEGSYLPAVEPQIPARPTFPQPAFQDAERPQIDADSDAIRIRPESPAATTAATDNTEQPLDAPAAPRPAQTQPAATAQTPAQPASSQPAASASASRTAALDVQGLPDSWSVRLGSFSNTANASSLVERLQNAGHRAYTRRVNSAQGQLTAVFVGPLVDRGAAEILLDRLRQDFQLNGMIVRYEIEGP
ncbi:MAG TPA: SPOR domain-containing protein [Pseudohongiella sp.]|nr:SPOR domain-containing protein [Pseudohongiella sp.]